MAERFYTDEQAQEILRMAARTSIGSGEISHSQLLETAAELGIRPDEVMLAEKAYLERQKLESDRKLFRKYKRGEFLKEVSQWVSGAALLYGIAWVTRGFEWHGLLATWPKWPVGFWGLFLIKNAAEYSMDVTVNYESSFERWRRKRDKKLAAKTEQEEETPASHVVRLTVGETDETESELNHVRRGPRRSE